VGASVTADLPIAFRGICPWCGFELPPTLTDDEREMWIWRDPEDPDPLGSFEDDLKKKLGELTARRVVTDDTDPAAFFEALKCPRCGAYLHVAFLRKVKKG